MIGCAPAVSVRGRAFYIKSRTAYSVFTRTGPIRLFSVFLRISVLYFIEEWLSLYTLPQKALERGWREEEILTLM